MTKYVSGLLYEYYFICKRKAWLSANGISMEDGYENVQIGKLIDENSYSREKKHVLIDENANIDFLRDDTVYEVKKSSKEEAASIAQIRYYLYVLHEKGLSDYHGELRVPEEKYTKEVVMTEADYDDVARTVTAIVDLINQPEIPKAQETRKCRSCAFYEFCFI